MKRISFLILILIFCSCRQNRYEVNYNFYNNVGCKIDATATDKQDLKASKETVIENLLDSIGL